MKYFCGIFGNEKNKEYFSAMISSGKLSHAYIIEGAPKSGKKLLIKNVIAAMACNDSEEKPCGKCLMCRKIFEEISPDVTYIAPAEGKKTISVDVIREATAKAYLTSNELDFKAYIISDSDALTPQAQNALLKFIEEPPHDVYIFLEAADAQSLLPTVRSRVQKITTEVFTPARLREYFSVRLKNFNDDDYFEYTVHNCAGSIGKVKELLETEKGKADYLFHKRIEALMTSASKCRYTGRKTAVIEELFDIASDGDELDKASEFLALAFRDIIALKTDEESEMLFFTTEENAQESVNAYTLKRATEIENELSQIHLARFAHMNAQISAAELAVTILKFE